MQKIILFLILFPALIFNSWPAAAGEEMEMILLQDANLRTGPGTDSAIIQALLKDTPVIKKDAARGWFKVFCPDINKTGWINAGLLRKQKIAIKEKKEPVPTAYSKKITLTTPQKAAPLPRPPKSHPVRTISPARHKLPPISIAVIDLQQVIEKSRKGREAREYFKSYSSLNSRSSSPSLPWIFLSYA